MKIGPNTESPLIADASLRPNRGNASVSGPGVAPRVDQVALSAAGAQFGGFGAADFDQAKVDAIRTAIREGRFSVNAGAIADRLIADAAALLSPKGHQ